MQRRNSHQRFNSWTAATLGTITNAAYDLSLAQPTLSGQIRALEEARYAELRYGNGTSLASNCGLLVNSASTVSTNDIYWGASSGPGADPADIVCGNTAAVLVGSPAGAADKVKIPSIK
jgi:hypothetical protein